MIFSALLGGLCGLLAGVVVLGLGFFVWKSMSAAPTLDASSTPMPEPDASSAPPKIIKLGAAAPGAIRSEQLTLPTEPGRRLGQRAKNMEEDETADDTWDDGELLTTVRTAPEHVDLDTLTGKVVLTSGAAILLEDASGKREWTCPRVHADVSPTIWIDVWGPLQPRELVVFAGHYRQVERVRYRTPERLPTLLQELGYQDVGEWYRVYFTFLKHNGVGGPGDAIADYAFGQDFKDALFAVDV